MRVSNHDTLIKYGNININLLDSPCESCLCKRIPLSQVIQPNDDASHLIEFKYKFQFIFSIVFPVSDFLCCYYVKTVDRSEKPMKQQLLYLYPRLK